jgi:hypothetical protein
LIYQYNTIVGAASRVVLVLSVVVVSVDVTRLFAETTVLLTKGCNGVNAKVSGAEEAMISAVNGLKIRTMMFTSGFCFLFFVIAK